MVVLRIKSDTIAADINDGQAADSIFRHDSQNINERCGRLAIQKSAFRLASQLKFYGETGKCGDTPICLNIDEENVILFRLVVAVHVDLHENSLYQIAAVEHSDEAVCIMVPNNSFRNLYEELKPTLHPP